MLRCILWLSLVLGLAAQAAKSKPTLAYRPPAGDPDERPIATEIVVGPQGSDFAMRVTFDKAPWGESCKNRCANLTLFVDTDNNRQTGLQLEQRDAKETGADLAVTLQGVREYRENSVDLLVRVKVRQLSNAASSVEDGDLLAEWNHRQDPERVYSEGKTLFVLVDATSGTLPTGKTARVVYHPPGAKALTATIKGMLGGASRKVEIFKSGKRSR